MIFAKSKQLHLGANFVHIAGVAERINFQLLVRLPLNHVIYIFKIIVWRGNWFGR